MEKNRKTLTGKVLKDKMDKSRVILVERKVKHPVYHKYVTKHKKLMVHDADNTSYVGDTVLIQEHTPYSKRKHWLLLQVLVQNQDHV